MIATRLEAGRGFSRPAASPRGAVIGMLIIQVIRSGLIFFGIDATWSTFVTGAVIVMAVSLDQLVKYQRTRRAERAKTAL